MRHLIFLLTAAAVALLAACGSSQQGAFSKEQPPASTPAPQSTQTTERAPTPESNTLPVAPSHGSGGGSSANTSQSSEQPNIDTTALDEKIIKAEAKAKAPGASAAERRAAAAAYLERANVYYSAGQPRLYKFALADFRRVLRYQPDNAEAREKQDMIVSIYQSMGRPVPEIGNEP